MKRVVIFLFFSLLLISGCASRQPFQVRFECACAKVDNLEKQLQYEEMDAYLRILYMDSRGKHLIDSLDVVDRTIGASYVK